MFKQFTLSLVYPLPSSAVFKKRNLEHFKMNCSCFAMLWICKIILVFCTSTLQSNVTNWWMWQSWNQITLQNTFFLAPDLTKVVTQQDWQLIDVKEKVITKWKLENMVFRLMSLRVVVADANGLCSKAKFQLSMRLLFSFFLPKLLFRFKLNHYNSQTSLSFALSLSFSL